MLLRKVLFLLLFSLILTFPALASGYSDNSVGTDTLVKEMSQDETILYNLINDIRLQNKLTSIPWSLSLSIVAHVHIDDLIASKPQDNGCSFHSWSGSGKWTACCHSMDPAGIQCMKIKPREITGYPGYGYELIYWGEEKATPIDAAGLWQQTEASADMILSRGKWNSYHWKALGVGIKNGYAILWLGEKTDKNSDVNPIKNTTIAKIPSENNDTSVKSKDDEGAMNEVNADQSDELNTKYYLIVSSVKTAESAKSELKRVKSKGYPEAVILANGSVYRISLGSFDTIKKAKTKLKVYKNVFPDIWVYKK